MSYELQVLPGRLAVCSLPIAAAADRPAQTAHATTNWHRHSHWLLRLAFFFDAAAAAHAHDADADALDHRARGSGTAGDVRSGPLVSITRTRDEYSLIVPVDWLLALPVDDDDADDDAASEDAAGNGDRRANAPLLDSGIVWRALQVTPGEQGGHHGMR